MYGIPALDNPNQAQIPQGKTGIPALDNAIMPTTQEQQAPKSFTDQVLNGIKSIFPSEGNFGQAISAAASPQIPEQVKQDTARTTQAADVMLQLAKQYPIGDPKRMQLIRVAAQMGSAPSQQDINPGFGMSDKQVLGSALGTGVDVLAGGSLPGQGASSFAMSKGTPVATSLLGKTLEGAGLGYGFDVSQNLQQNKDNYLQPGLGTAIGGALPGVMAGAGALTKSIIGKYSPVSNDLINFTQQHADEVQQTVKKYASTPEAKEGLVNRAMGLIDDLNHQRQVEYGQALSGLTTQEELTTQPAVEAFKAAVKDELGGRAGQEVSFGDNLAFKNTKLAPEEQSALNELWKTINNWTDYTPQGLDALRQRVANTNVTGYAGTIVGQTRKALEDYLTEKVPGYSDMLSQYVDQSSLLKSLKAELSASSNSPTTKLNKLLSIFNQKSPLRQNLIKQLGPRGDELLNDIAGAILSDWLPHGGLGNTLRGMLQAGTLTAGLFNPAAFGAAAAEGLASSPRVIGQGAIMAGKAAQTGIGTGIRRGLTKFFSNAGQ